MSLLTYEYVLWYLNCDYLPLRKSEVGGVRWDQGATACRGRPVGQVGQVKIIVVLIFVTVIVICVAMVLIISIIMHVLWLQVEARQSWTSWPRSFSQKGGQEQREVDDKLKNVLEYFRREGWKLFRQTWWWAICFTGSWHWLRPKSSKCLIRSRPRSRVEVYTCKP